MIYFDNSATTELLPSVKQKMIEALECFGNPSSRHTLGMDARRLVEGARTQVALSLGLRESESQRIIFTSCGTEANNLAVLGGVRSKQRNKGSRIITTDSEHPSVENAMRRLESEGFEVTRIRTVGGVLDIEQFEACMNQNVALVSMMCVNNETGAVYDVGRIFEIAKKINPNVITHTDFVQGYLKADVEPMKLNADLISISAHKIHGPKGVGALYVSPETVKTKRLVSVIEGGGQESGMRSGTENVVCIAGFGEAARAGYIRRAENRERLISLRSAVEQAAAFAGAAVNIPQGERAPHIVSITLPRIKSETMLNYLSSKGICVSSGSACSSHSAHISSSLIGFGLTQQQADSTIRVSLCESNTEDEVRQFGDVLRDGIGMLVRFKR